jgi:diketogulonate reductase-like aldo/keto reductase
MIHNAVDQGVVPIPGSKQIKYVEENMASVNVKLGTGEVAHI